MNVHVVFVQDVHTIVCSYIHPV